MRSSTSSSLRDETVDVEAVERRDPGLVQALDRLVRDVVAGALLLADLERQLLLAVDVLEHLQEQLRRLHAPRGVLREGVEEDVALRLGAEHAAAKLDAVQVRPQALDQKRKKPETCAR